MKTVSDIRRGTAILYWDMDVMMPPLAATERIDINSTLNVVLHEKKTDPVIADWIKEAEDEVQSEWDKRNLALIKQDYLLDTQLPERLVKELSEAQVKTGRLWQAAKEKSDWQSVQSSFEELFVLIKEETGIIGNVLGKSNYDAQLYIFSNGNSQQVIDPLFSMLKKELPPLVQEIVEKQKSFPAPKPFSIPVAQQENIVREVIQRLGYDFRRGRLDVSMHPASYGTPNDSRITTRYTEASPLEAIYGAIHESGHALYNGQLPKEWNGQPVGVAGDVCLHESQSLIMERYIGLNDGFIEYLNDIMQQNNIDTKGPENIKAILRQVQPSFIRLGADEVTYPLHIIIRYEIEKALFNDDIKVADIPFIWNEKMKEYLGLEVKEHRFGCMQDMHWFDGMFGYFPTYTQGALYAAQLFNTATKEIDGLQQQIRLPDMGKFNGFLEDKIHRWGQFYDAPDLIEQATGEKPNAKYFLDHLKNRYL